MNKSYNSAQGKNDRSQIASYYEAIAYVKEMQKKARELRESCDAEIELFETTMSHARSLYARVRSAGYIGSEKSIEEKRKDFIQKFNAFTSTQLCAFVRYQVEILEGLINEQGKYCSQEDDEKRREDIVRYSTYFHIMINYFAGKENCNHKILIRNLRSECEYELKELYDKTLELVRPFCSTSAKAAKGYIGKIDESVEHMPEDFSDSARIDIGYYEEQNEGRLEYASKLIDGDRNELEYKRLILDIANANRTDSVLSVDISSQSESNNIIIHQPRYSLREIDRNGRGDDDRVMIELLESMMCRYMGLLPRISKRICVIQNRELSELDAFANNLYRTANELVFTDVSKEGSIGFSNTDEALKALLGECRSAKDIFCRNVYDFNKTNYSKGIWKQMTLLVIKDYPLGFDARSVNNLNNILQDANKYGIHVVMTVCDDLLARAKERMRDTDFESVFEYFDPLKSFMIEDHRLISKYTYESVDFSEAVIDYDSFNMRKYLSNLERYISNSSDPAIPLETLIDQKGYEADTERRKNFFKVLDFPIGKIGTSDCNMKLYQSGGGSPHVVIAGTTGSGKSVLLQDIILSAACHYSPDELEMYLFDFKETPKGFERYKTGFPHVRKIATQCKERDILELFSMIKSIYTKRMARAGELGYTDIRSYNAYAKKNGLPQFPRIMVLIDEYQTIQSDKCINLLLEIAQKGREFGVAIIMASQSNNPQQGFTKILKLFGHRIEFKNEPLGGLINRISTRAQDLNGPKGLCFYSNDGSAGLPVLLRCAYVNDEDNEAVKKFADIISQRYGSSQGYSTYHVGDIQRIERPVDLVDGSFATLGELAKRDPSIKPFNDEITSEAEWLISAKGKYQGSSDLRDRGFLLRLGVNSLSLAGVDIKLDRSSPFLLLCGDLSRSKSLEYSVIRSAALAASATAEDRKTLIYYIDADGKCNKSLPVYHAAERLPYVKAVSPSLESINAALDEINEEYMSRKKATGYAEYTPMLVMLSSFDSLISMVEEQKNDASSSPSAGVPSSTQEIMDKYRRMAAAMQASSTENADGAKNSNTVAHRSNKSTDMSEKLKKLFSSDMYNYGIFFVVQMSDTAAAVYLKGKLNSSKNHSMVYLPKSNVLEIEQNDILKQMTEYSSMLSGYKTINIEKDEMNFSYGYKLIEDTLTDFIPYEFI